MLLAMEQTSQHPNHDDFQFYSRRVSGSGRLGGGIGESTEGSPPSLSLPSQHGYTF